MTEIPYFNNGDSPSETEIEHEPTRVDIGDIVTIKGRPGMRFLTVEVRSLDNNIEGIHVNKDGNCVGFPGGFFGKDIEQVVDHKSIDETIYMLAKAFSPGQDQEPSTEKMEQANQILDDAQKFIDTLRSEPKQTDEREASPADHDAPEAR